MVLRPISFKYLFSGFHENAWENGSPLSIVLESVQKSCVFDIAVMKALAESTSGKNWELSFTYCLTMKHFFENLKFLLKMPS